MDNATKELALPPVNFVFSLRAFICVVTYRNIGQLRFSAQPIAMCAEENKTKERFFLTLDSSRKKLSPDEFDAYLKDRYPQYPPEIPPADPPPDEQPGAQVVESGKPKNVTLNVHSGSFPQTGGFKKQ